MRVVRTGKATRRAIRVASRKLRGLHTRWMDKATGTVRLVRLWSNKVVTSSSRDKDGQILKGGG